MAATSTTKLASSTAIEVSMSKFTIVLLALCSVSVGAFAKGGSSGGSHAISGHVTKNGTYVAPSHATNPNSVKTDNYSHKGNTNPYTGKPGTKD